VALVEGPGLIGNLKAMMTPENSIPREDARIP